LGDVVALTVPTSKKLIARLALPQVLLIGLADAERYRGARLPLGISRLSQWLRFTHSARVSIIDYNIDIAPAVSIERHLTNQPPDILGISVNFGQWQMLEDLARTVTRYSPPIIVLGNILAAHSADRAADLFRGMSGCLLIATSLGERPLETLCRNHDRPSAWSSIPGLASPGKATSVMQEPVVPPAIVHPDDGMIEAIAHRSGQISLETSFGCQFGKCTFCPRDHRGKGWTRADSDAVIATLERIATCGAVVSFVDEEFFGQEGLLDPPPTSLAASEILSASRRCGMKYELYTRLEQLFDRRRSREWNLRRAEMLALEAQSMKRLFVGVESGSPSQLRRYGKGQTVAQIEDSLAVGSALGLPLEFGFITFDPLLSPAELTQNLHFLARKDILAMPISGVPVRVADAAATYYDGGKLQCAAIPIYQRVAYMATELEVLTRSRYAAALRRSRPELLGDIDPNFARYTVTYDDPRIGEIVGWCRVWTEGMFVPIYEARMRARSDKHASAVVSRDIVTRYREATFAYLVAIAAQLLPDFASSILSVTPDSVELGRNDPERWLYQLARWTMPECDVVFDLSLRTRGRQR
jgi:hypothetical protein